MSDPRRGEVWWVDFGMAGKIRPALVVSTEITDEDYALIAVVPHTTSTHGSRFAWVAQVHGLKPGAFNIQGLGPVPRAKFIRLAATLSAEQMRSLDEAVRHWLRLG